MTKLYSSFRGILCAVAIMVAFGASASSGDSESSSYPGYITVNMYDDDIITDQNAVVIITAQDNGKVTFSLPDFAIDLGDGPVPLGDIVVPDVAVTESDGVKTYSGSLDGMKLLQGMLAANVVINGTIDASGKADMNIDVMWINDGNKIPIKVKFTSEKSGISDISVDEPHAETVYYNLNGTRVTSGNLTPGVYLCRRGGKVTKVLVK